jgi:small-conductance mechanosensitive channel
MNKLYEFLSDQTGFSELEIKRGILTIITFLVMGLISQIIARLINKNIKESKDAYQWRKTKNYILFLIGILIIANIWGLKVKNFATYFGLLSAGIAIALKDPLTNVAGWLFIMARRPFGITDRIQVGDLKGDIVDQRIFHFTIIEIGNWVDADQTTGRLIHIPNGIIFRESLSNYSSTFNFIWNEIAVLVTFESDWKKAKSILKKIVENHGSEKAKLAQEEIKKLRKNLPCLLKIQNLQFSPQ